jgi:hypothetical protein
MVKRITFSIRKIQQLRRKAEQIRRVPEKGPEGWRKSEVDPMRLFEVFTSLWLKEGLVLRAYVYRWGIGGNGIVWAMPQELHFPEPAKCFRVMGKFFYVPKPPGVLNDVMEAIEGNGSLWSYLCASLFAREVSEFGAWWHGSNWNTHVILGNDPWNSSYRSKQRSYFEGSSENPDNWRWIEPKPSEWKPQIFQDINTEIVTVMFHTFSGLLPEGIYHHRDIYRRDSYCFESDEKIIAEGPGGYIF